MKHGVFVTIVLVLVFFISQLVGLTVTNKYITKEVNAITGEVENITASPLPLSMERPEVEESQSYIYILGAVLIGTILVLLLIKFKGVMIWKFWFFISVALCLTIAFAAFIPQIAAIIIGCLLAILKVYRTNFIIHNVTEVFIYGGLAAIFVPIMNIYAVVILLLLISVYDVIAVWQSKHMVKMAKFQTASKVFAGLSIPYNIPKMKEIFRIGRIKQKANTKSTKVARKKSKKKSEIKSAILGGGDMGFPLLFAGVLLKTNPFVNVLIIPAAAAVALFLLLYYAKKNKFYPAMPFITAGCLVGYAILILI